MAMRVNTFSERYPRGYLCAALILMLPGYFFLFLFPWFAFEGVSVLIAALSDLVNLFDTPQLSGFSYFH